jgi:uncharacterized iron-regulated protein
MRRFIHVILAALFPFLALACAGPSAQRVPDQAAQAKVETQAHPEVWASTLSADHVLVGKIWSVSEALFVDRATISQRVAAARFVLLGERHDNADHHRLQAEMVRVVAQAGRKPAVVFEMIDHSMQTKVDEQLTSAPGQVDAFAEAIGWAESGWPAWEIYRPVFAAVLENQLPIIGAGLPRKDAMDIARGGGLPAELVAKYKLDAPMPEPQQSALLQQLEDSHCGHMPASMMPPMMNVQRARDAIMADGLSTRATAGGAILIAGGGHVRVDRGVPWYMGQQPGAGSVTSLVAIGFAEVSDGVTDPAAYAEYYDGSIPFDYLWFTPRDNDIDQCKELEERMKKMKAGHEKAPAAPAGKAAE